MCSIIFWFNCSAKSRKISLISSINSLNLLNFLQGAHYTFLQFSLSCCRFIYLHTQLQTMRKTFLAPPDRFSRALLISSVLLAGQGRTADWSIGCRWHSNTDNYYSPGPTSQINSSNQWSKLSFVIYTEPVGVEFSWIVAPHRHNAFQN